MPRCPETNKKARVERAGQEEATQQGRPLFLERVVVAPRQNNAGQNNNKNLVEQDDDHSQGDKQKALATIESHRMGFRMVPDKFKSDPEVAMAALRKNFHGAIAWIRDTRLLNNVDFCQTAMDELDNFFLSHVSEPLRNDRGIVLKGVSKSGFYLQFASAAWQNDREICWVAVTGSAWALQFVSRRLQSDRELVLRAVRQSGRALRFTTPELQGDKEIVAAAVRNDGQALEYASVSLQNNRTIVLQALETDGQALYHASTDLKADRNVVLTAVRENGRALAYASEMLRGDAEVVKEALQTHGEALRYASKECKSNVTLVAVAIRNWSLSYSDRLEMAYNIGFVVDFEDSLKNIRSHLWEREKLYDKIISFADDSEQGKEGMAARKYAETWIRDCREVLWILASCLGETDVVRMIAEYAELQTQFHAARELTRLSPVFSAYAYRGIGWKDIYDPNDTSDPSRRIVW